MTDITLKLKEALPDTIINKFNGNNSSIDINNNEITIKELNFDDSKTLNIEQAVNFIETLNLLKIAAQSEGANLSLTNLAELKKYQINYNPNAQDNKYIDQEYSPQPLDFAIADLLKDEDYLHNNSYDIEERAEKAKDEIAKRQRAQENVTLTAVNNLFDEILPNNPCSFFTVSALKPINHTNRKHARDEGRKKLNEGYIDAVIKTMIDWGSETIIVWDNERDQQEDGSIKKGVQSHTKLFTYTLKTRSTPVVLEFYVGKIGSRVSGKETAPGLKQLKDLGYSHFSMPSASELGKPLFKAYLEGAVVSGMIPRLKHSPKDTNGMELSYGDLNDLMKLWKDKSEGKKPDDRIKFSLGLAKEVELYCTQGGGPADLLCKAESLKMQATFEKFNQSYAGKLSDYMAQQQWDKVDVIAARAAMSRILEELQKGSLYNPENQTFEAYNPLADNGNKLIETFKYYQADNNLKNKIRLEIKAEKDTEANSKDLKRDRIKEVEKRYEIAWKKAVGDVSSYGIKMEDIIFPAGTENAHTSNTYNLPNQRGNSR